MGIFRRAALVLAAVIVGGCGGSSHTSSGSSRGATSGSAGAASSGSAGAASSGSAGAASSGPAAFAWLHPAIRPAAWPVTTIADGASIAFPAGWRRVSSDPRTATAALLGPHDAFVGYLNLTPRQGDESLSDWASFRVDHNAEEGDRAVATQAVTTDQRLGSQRWSCVQDAYTTSARTRYVELACLVAGPHTSVVVVGASPPQAWPKISPLLERAIDGVTA